MSGRAMRTRAVTVASSKTIEERDSLMRQLRRAVRRRNEAFDRGFEAAVLMAEAGASPGRLREAVPTIVTEMYDTQPVLVVTAEDGAEPC